MSGRSWRIIMKKQNLYFAVATLAVGVSLAIPAFAQQRNPNDGGVVAVAPGAKLDSPASAATPAAPFYGRNANDGGTGPEPHGQQASATKSRKKSTAEAAAPHYGRASNDGGVVQ
jgi:hypothetical protein